MVLAAADVSGGKKFLIRPNCSLTGRQMRVVFLLQVGVGLGIVIGFAMMDLWFVLPFAGLELTALGVCLYVCGADARRQQVVRVRDAIVDVAKSGRGLTRSWRFPRGWAQVRLLRPRVNGYPSTLVIRSHGNSVTVGEFLGEDERVRLAVDLGRAIVVRPFATDPQ